MITFLDGPACPGAHGLLLGRAPLYLRVVQLEDQPEPAETVHAYRREGPVTQVHIDFCRGRGRSRSGWYLGATYQLVSEQPCEEVLRDTQRWRVWTIEQRDLQRKEPSSA